MAYENSLSIQNDPANDMMGCGCVAVAFLVIIFGCGGGWWYWLGPSASDLCDPASINCDGSSGAIQELVQENLLTKARAADDGSGDLHLDVWVTASFWNLSVQNRTEALERVRDELLCGQQGETWSGWALVLFDADSGQQLDRIECAEYGSWMPVDSLIPSN